MPEWEAFYFRKFFKDGYLVYISKMVRILAICWNNLQSCNLKITLMFKRRFRPPVHLAFHFCETNLAHILRFAKGIS